MAKRISWRRSVAQLVDKHETVVVITRLLAVAWILLPRFAVDNELVFVAAFGKFHTRRVKATIVWAVHFQCIRLPLIELPGQKDTSGWQGRLVAEVHLVAAALKFF